MKTVTDFEFVLLLVPIVSCLLPPFLLSMWWDDHEWLQKKALKNISLLLFPSVLLLLIFGIINDRFYNTLSVSIYSVSLFLIISSGFYMLSLLRFPVNIVQVILSLFCVVILSLPFVFKYIGENIEGSETLQDFVNIIVNINPFIVSCAEIEVDVLRYPIMYRFDIAGYQFSIVRILDLSKLLFLVSAVFFSIYYMIVIIVLKYRHEINRLIK